MRTDGQTDITKLIVAFLSFTKAPKREREREEYRCICFAGASVVLCYNLPAAVEFDIRLFSTTACSYVI